jgi:hypothetical protein
MYKIVSSNYFLYFMMLCTVSNTIFLTLDSYPKRDIGNYVELINEYYTIIFVIEFFMKLLGLGIKGYFLDAFNILDCSIVVISVVDIIISNTSNSSNASIVIAIRAFRVISLFKLARTWRRFH